MRVRELIDILNDQPPEAEIELAIIAPIAEDADDITVDRYTVEGILPWDEDAGAPAEDVSNDLVIWLVGGEESDVDAFLDAIEPEDDDSEDDDSEDDDHDGHDHDGHDHDGHDHDSA